MKRILTILLLVSLMTFTVHAQFNGPVGNDDSYATSQNIELKLDAKDGVLKNDTPNGAKVVFASTSTGGGTVAGGEDGAFTYVPAADFTGTDSFEYTLEGDKGTVETTVNITVYSALGGLGWVFMFLSIGGVWALGIFCYKKLLFDGD